MTKRKTFRLSEQSRNSLKAELSKYKSGPPLGKIAKTYGVSLSTVNYHWATIQHARKVGRKLDKDLSRQMERSLAENTEQEALRALVGVKKPTYVATPWSEDETVTKPVTTVRLPIDKRGTDFAIAVGLAEPVKPNGHITVTIDQAWLKPIVEEVARTEVRDYLQTAFRK